MEKLKKAGSSIASVTPGAWLRLALLLLSMVNMVLMGLGVKTLPFDSERVGRAAGAVFAVVSALAAYWKNNSFTAAAQAADRVLRGELTAIPKQQSGEEVNENKL